MQKSQIKGFKKAINIARTRSADAFFTWFNGEKDAEAAFVAGAWDFSTLIAPSLASKIDNPDDKVVLDIGYGGGRILASACKHFKRAIGIDVHDCKDAVNDELKKRGINNFELINSDGKSIPLSAESVDVVYSFIVLQHLDGISVFDDYFSETYRVLKKGGVAVLYFGRYCKFSVNSKHRLWYYVDRLLELFFLIKGFRELSADINHITLLVSPVYAKKLSRKLGFRVCELLVSRRNSSAGRLYGLQHGLVIKK